MTSSVLMSKTPPPLPHRRLRLGRVVGSSGSASSPGAAARPLSSSASMRMLSLARPATAASLPRTRLSHVQSEGRLHVRRRSRVEPKEQQQRPRPATGGGTPQVRVVQTASLSGGLPRGRSASASVKRDAFERTKSSLSEINTFLATEEELDRGGLAVLQALLRNFVSTQKQPPGVDIPELNPLLGSEESRPQTAAAVRSRGLNNLAYVLPLLSDAAVFESPGVLQLLLQTLNILAVEAADRDQFDAQSVAALVEIFDVFADNPHVRLECAHVLLNLCRSEAQCISVVHANGVTSFLDALSSESTTQRLQVLLLGALQALCFYGPGREAVFDSAGHDFASLFLRSSVPSVRRRAAAFLHNLSVHAPAVEPIRELGAVSVLVDYLSSTDEHLRRSAAGTLQNMARDAQSQAEIVELNGVDKLSSLLLCSSDLLGQACAAGALLNLVGGDNCPPAYKRLLSAAIVYSNLDEITSPDE